MKKQLLLLLFCNLLTFSFFTTKSQNNSSIQISNNKSSLQVSFLLPTFSIIDTSLVEPFGITELFNYIQIDNEFDNEYGDIDSVGLPQLPQLSFDLHVPFNATGFTVNVTSTNTSNLGINRKIMPTQDDYEKEDSVFVFSMNNSYYNSTGGFCNSYIQFNESFIVFGEQGINLTIFPFIYNPAQNTLTVLNNAVFTISYILSKDTVESYHTEAKDEYLSSLFLNYDSCGKSRAVERYLMITSPEYESTLTYFANYKRNLGYEVEVVTVDTPNNTSFYIKYKIILPRYANISTRPTYVLLVGDVDKIPASAGNPSGNSEDDPITDYWYSILHGSDFLADVFLGRFSVSNTIELTNIINKTIFMEMNMKRFTKKAKFLAGKDGTDNWIYMESEFKRGHNYVIPYSFNPLGYSCQKLYQPSQTSAVNALSDNPLFYIYAGHGGFYSLAGHSFSIDWNVVGYATNTVFPFVFSFACKTGNFAKVECIGESFIRAKNGAVAYFGCSVNSLTMSDVALEKKIFGDAFLKDEKKLSVIINLGKRRFTYVVGIRKKIKNRYLKAYNLLGDPSFNTKEIECKQNLVFNYPEVFKNGADVTYRADNLIQNNNSFVVESGAEVKLLAGNTIVLKPGFEAKAGSNVQLKLIPCNNTIYLSPENNNEEDTIITDNILQPEIEEVTDFAIEKDEIFYPAIFSVFPNPTTDDFSLAYTLEETSFVKIDLFNMQGIHIKDFLQIVQQDAGVYFHNFSLSGLSSGVYVLIFKSSSKTLSTKIFKH